MSVYRCSCLDEHCERGCGDCIFSADSWASALVVGSAFYACDGTLCIECLHEAQKVEIDEGVFVSVSFEDVCQDVHSDTFLGVDVPDWYLGAIGGYPGCFT